MPDLSLIPTDELLTELQGRFEHYLFVGNAPRSDKEDQTIYRYAGNWLTLLGANARIAYLMQQEMDEDATTHGMSDA